ncbi:uncharacterized protein LOC130433918 isoform X2 [Triplophysa dalaica]|uniref:uncharacterized protein LOC130433918 isoform X2 n=1 Tax=Triplophysa dalaica TaxID=1582913 RepID=UPI0024E00EA8|nr:uncharacterized protein LOC130433918 isoform X2 [Triplophysa dalaica]
MRNTNNSALPECLSRGTERGVPAHQSPPSAAAAALGSCTHPSCLPRSTLGLLCSQQSDDNPPLPRSFHSGPQHYHRPPPPKQCPFENSRTIRHLSPSAPLRAVFLWLPAVRPRLWIYHRSKPHRALQPWVKTLITLFPQSDWAHFSVREGPTERPAAITQKNLHRRAAAMASYIKRFETVNIHQAVENSVAEHLGAVMDTSPPAFLSGANAARFLQLMATLLMTGFSSN